MIHALFGINNSRTKKNFVTKAEQSFFYTVFPEKKRNYFKTIDKTCTFLPPSRNYCISIRKIETHAQAAEVAYLFYEKYEASFDEGIFILKSGDEGFRGSIDASVNRKLFPFSHPFPGKFHWTDNAFSIERVISDNPDKESEFFFDSETYLLLLLTY